MKRGERTRRMILEKSAEILYKRLLRLFYERSRPRHGPGEGWYLQPLREQRGAGPGNLRPRGGAARERFRETLENREGALERLSAVVDVRAVLAEDPPIVGGCPLLNTAVESDGAHAGLKEKARDAMSGWLRLVGGIVKEGVRSEELEPDADPRYTASGAVATLEGAMMLSKLYDDPVYMRRAAGHLNEHLISLARRTESSGV